jgi:hypothetical protein
LEVIVQLVWRQMRDITCLIDFRRRKAACVELLNMIRDEVERARYTISSPSGERARLAQRFLCDRDRLGEHGDGGCGQAWLNDSTAGADGSGVCRRRPHPSFAERQATRCGPGFRCDG